LPRKPNQKPLALFSTFDSHFGHSILTSQFEFCWVINYQASNYFSSVAQTISGLHLSKYLWPYKYIYCIKLSNPISCQVLFRIITC
jgi:hypothetical protein